jgi:HEPN domain-containing protein
MSEYAHKIFRTAEIFYAVERQMLDEIYHQRLVAHIPMAVNGAFAMELYLKALCTLDLGSTPKGHKLADLFRLLKSTTQQQIEDRFNAWKTAEEMEIDQGEVVSIPVDLRDFLERSTDAFTVFRYAFEPGSAKKGTGYFLGDVTPAVRRVIVDRHPNWKASIVMPLHRFIPLEPNKHSSPTSDLTLPSDPHRKLVEPKNHTDYVTCPGWPVVDGQAPLDSGVGMPQRSNGDDLRPDEV